MKNKKLVVLPLALMFGLSLAACKNNGGNSDNGGSKPSESTTVPSTTKPQESHTHSYSTDWTYNESKHWHASTCDHDLKSEEASHTIVNGKCSVCGFLEGTDGIGYKLADDGASYIVAGVDEEITLSGDIAVASYYEGKPVTGIESSALARLDEVTSIALPSTISSIGDRAFYDCQNLTSINLPKGITSIGRYTFMYCPKLASIDIPDTVTSIGESAFYSCNALTSIVIPDSVTSIAQEAFESCENLVNITISNNLTYLGVHAFADSNKLTYTEYEDGKYLGSSTNKYLILVEANTTDKTTFKINDNCKFIYDEVFSNSASLTSIVIPDSVISIGQRVLGSCPKLESITFSNNLSFIGEDAFYDCAELAYYEYADGLYLGNQTNNYLVFVKPKNTDIRTLTINENCKIINSRAFDNCYSLIYATIPNSVIGIGAYAFSYCNDLIEISLSTNLTYIDEMAFYHCVSLATLVLPNSIKLLGSNVIDECTQLTSITYNGTRQQWSQIIIGSQDQLEEITINYKE